ncbi:MAG: AAA family ATPase [Oscillospiraceae bacterium]|jgi:AAA+ superfamily predicted ATPase|nr:AAA family ATPase [Oscillospiraceae bacterium]
MQFYKIEAEVTNVSKKDITELCKDFEYTREIQLKMDILHETRYKDCLIFISSMRNGELLLGAVVQNEVAVEQMYPVFLSSVDIHCNNVGIEEITLNAIIALLDLSSQNNFTRGSHRFYERLDLEALQHNNESFSESMFPEDVSLDDLLRKTDHLLCQASLAPELHRIFTPARNRVSGHPVHYIIQTDDADVGDEIVRILLSALYANGRIKSRRYLRGRMKKSWSFFGGSNESTCKTLYRICDGGSVIINMIVNLFEEEDILTGDAEKVEMAGKLALNFRNQTLSIFILPRSAERLKFVLREHLGNMTLVEITEDDVTAEDARTFLKRSAREHKVRVDKSLYRDISDAQKTYSVSGLKKSFNDWYDNQLKTRCYTQYAQFESVGRIVARKKSPLGDAARELDKMIGLQEAKSVINQAVDYYKAQKLFIENGIDSNRPAMHMVFTGSPGTAKTSAARLFARIMKDNGLLSVGNLVEVGRADLVGKYVGWTAPTVVKKFKEAMGSVLFIDEAYSLVDGKDGYFGDEAISTIVQEMENRREDVVVIFAGYTDKMEGFLQRNPGLRSRIAFHVPFADYNSEELYEILALIAKRESMTIGDDVKEKLLPIMETAMLEPDFGNGRYMRNIYESARMKQSSRLITIDKDKITKVELTTLMAVDFEILPTQSKKVGKIGFVS